MASIRRGVRLPGCRDVGQEDAEHGSMLVWPGTTPHADAATVFSHDFGADPQTKTGSAGRLGADKRFEDVRSHGIGDAGPGIGDEHLHAAASRAVARMVQADLDAPAGSRIDRVREMFERFMLRRFYTADPILSLLVTFGLAMVAEQAIRIVWGAAPLSAVMPQSLKGAVIVGDFLFSRYRLVLDRKSVV